MTSGDKLVTEIVTSTGHEIRGLQPFGDKVTNYFFNVVILNRE